MIAPHPRTTSSLMGADPDPRSIRDACREGRVEVRPRPLTRVRIVTLLGDLQRTACARRRDRLQGAPAQVVRL